jgi:hypothetical protein
MTPGSRTDTYGQAGCLIERRFQGNFMHWQGLN